MARSISLNGTSYSIPQTGDSGWSLTGGVDDYLVALATGVLTKAGGTFTLTAEVDFGATYGLKPLYVKSQTTGAATTGVVRLAKTDAVAWRNNANSADLSLSISAGDLLQYNSIVLADISSSQTLTNKTMSGSSNTFTNLPASGLTGIVPPANGGTGVANNAASTLTIAGNFGTTLTVSGTTAVTLPTSGTLATLAGSETLTNKTLTAPVISTIANSGTLTLPTGPDTLVGRATSDTLTNKTLSTGTVMTAGKITTAVAEVDPADNTKQWNATLSGSTTGTATTFAFAQTANRTLTMPDATDTLVGRATTDTLTNKTLTAPAVTGLTGTLSAPTISGGTHTGVTNFALRDTSAAFDVTEASTSSVTLTAGRTRTWDMANASWTLKAGPLSNFSTLTDGSATQVLSTLGGGSGYAWASALTSTLNQYNVTVGNASNTATATNTNLLGSVVAQSASQTATITIATPGVLTVTTAPATGATVYLTTTGALPTGLAASTTYYAINVSGTTLKLATTLGNALAGTAIGTSGSQSGTHTLFTGGLTLPNGLPASSTNDNALTGYLAEEITSGVTPGPLNTSTYANIATITLTAGNWEVSAVASNPGVTSLTGVTIGISTASGTSNTGFTLGQTEWTGAASATFGFTATINPYRVTVANGSTKQLWLNGITSGAGCTATGVLRAVRPR